MRVFKYRGGDEEIFIRDVKSLEANMFYASSSEMLNDPCETIVNSENIIDKAKLLSKFIGFKDSGSLDMIDESYRKVLSFDKKMGIYSLSQTYLDELLWAHYGNSHKGFCIEYDLDLLLETYKTDKRFAFPVKYNSKPPRIRLSDIINNENDLFVKKLGGYKSERWMYEKEYRIITNKFGLQSYNYKSVKSIFFGLRMLDSHKKEIMNRLKGRGINYYQIEQTKNSYKFQANLIEDINGKELTYLNQIPPSVTNCKSIKFTIIEKDYTWYNGKATISIELETKVKDEELKWVGNLIRNNIFPLAERIFMFYYIVSQSDRTMAWATTNYDNGKINLWKNDYVELNLSNRF